MIKPRRDRLAGIYLHVPFCAKVCPYCDFAVTAQRHIPHEAYADAILTEWGARRDTLATRDVRTLYLGGGTPSRWDDDALGRALTTIREQLPKPLEEITIEANPSDITDARLDRWHALGITRLSLGCQSFQDVTLRTLGRNHDAATATQAVERILARGTMCLSIDLIYGCPDQTLAMWERDLAQLERWPTLHHVSLYNLTIEPGTPFGRQHLRGALALPQEPQQGQMQDRSREVLHEMGLHQYEVSSFAREGYHSRHNSLYWLGGEYVGLGVGAHSMTIDERGVVWRRANARNLKDYLRAPHAPATAEALEDAEHLAERVFVNLRTRLGLDWEELLAQLSDAPLEGSLARTQQALERLVAGELLTREGARYLPTTRGLDVADAMARLIADAVWDD